MSAATPSGQRVALGLGVDGYLSGGRKNAPGIVVIQEAFGVNAFVKATCDRFAEGGYYAVAPDYYHGRTFDYADRDNAIAAVNDVDDELAMRETGLALDALVERGARKDRLAVIGFCMGGRLAFLANASLKGRVAATISFYGGGIAPLSPRESASRCSIASPRSPRRRCSSTARRTLRSAGRNMRDSPAR